MDIDFHTHGKLAKYLAFSPDYMIERPEDMTEILKAMRDAE